MKMIARKMSLWLICLSLNGCYAQSKCEVLLDPQQAHVVAKQFFTAFARRDLEAMSPWLSYPFYADGIPQNPQELAQDLPNDRSTNTAMPTFDIELRLYPVEDLAVLWPKMWRNLQPHLQSERESLYLAPVVLRFEENKTEKGWLLLRQTQAGWRVAGMLD